MFQQKLKALRAQRSQSELANELNVSRGAVGMWESGERLPNYEMLKKISNYFNVSIDYLLDNEKFTEQTQRDLVEIPDNKKETVQQLLALPESMFIYISGQISACYQVSKPQ